MNQVRPDVKIVTHLVSIFHLFITIQTHELLT